MDGLSAAATVITVASVAVQLSESIKTLFEFWISIKDAPDDIHAITTDLQILSSILKRIAFDAQRLRPDPSMIAALNSGSSKIKKLKNIVDDLESGFRSTNSLVRRWSSLKTLFRSDRLRDFQDSLERTKSTLTLIQIIHQGSFICSQHDMQQQSLATMAQDVSALNMNYSLKSVSTFSSTSSAVPDHTSALQTEIFRVASAMPNPVYRSLFELGMNKALQETLGRLGCLSSEKEMNPTDLHVLQQEQNRKSLIVDYTSPKQPFWIIRNVRRYDFVVKNFIGTFYIRSKTNVLQCSFPVDRLNDGTDFKYEHVTSFCASPAPWLVKLGMNYGFKVSFQNSAIWGWKHVFNTFRQVRDDAMIFEFCKEGNVSGVQILLSRGRASVRDTDSRGRTPLFYAAAYHRTQLCKLLISAGADKNARTFQETNLHRPWDPLNPVMAAASCFDRDAFKGTQCIDTLRLFTDCIDFSDHDSDGWLVMYSLHQAFLTGCTDKQPHGLPGLLFLPLFSSELKDNFDESRFALMLRWNVIHAKLDEITRLLFGMFKTLLANARESPNGYSTLQCMITSGSISSAQIDHAIEILLQNGTDPHLVGLNLHYSSQPETPTSLALYTSSTFTQWRNALKKMSFDFEAFVEQELQRGPLKAAGWRQDTLLALFRQDFRSGAKPQYKHDFGECPHLLSALIVEPCWLHWLQGFKEGMSSDLRPERKMEANGKDDQGRIMRKGLESVRINESTDEGFEHLEAAEILTASVPVKSHYNAALFEDGSVRPRLACIGCWSKTKSVEWVPLRGSATPSSACAQGQDILLSSIPTNPSKKSRRR